MAGPYPQRYDIRLIRYDKVGFVVDFLPRCSASFGTSSPSRLSVASHNQFYGQLSLSHSCLLSAFPRHLAVPRLARQDDFKTKKVELGEDMKKRIEELRQKDFKPVSAAPAPAAAGKT